ncbi:hypothetical protein CB1_000191013 [Camelus ferus]|nr:hypothetical protein CB1_000191013 [Camelus ferus]
MVAQPTTQAEIRQELVDGDTHSTSPSEGLVCHAAEGQHRLWASMDMADRQLSTPSSNLEHHANLPILYPKEAGAGGDARDQKRKISIQQETQSKMRKHRASKEELRLRLPLQENQDWVQFILPWRGTQSLLLQETQDRV